MLTSGTIIKKFLLFLISGRKFLPAPISCLPGSINYKDKTRDLLGAKGVGSSAKKYSNKGNVC